MSAHALLRAALEQELPWLRTAVYRDLAVSGSPDQRLLAQLALGESLRPGEGVDPVLVALALAQRHLDQGAAQASLSCLEGVVDPRAVPLRAQALAELDRARPLRREVREALRAYPEQPHLSAIALRHQQDTVLDFGLRSQALSAAGELLVGEEPTTVYRAHALYLSLGERELALAAASRLDALGEVQALAAHRSWSDAMTRDLGRLLALQGSPKLLDGATPQEQARALTWAAREKSRKGQSRAAQALWEQLLTLPQVPSPLYLEALLALEMDGRSPQQLLLEAEELRMRVATLGADVPTAAAPRIVVVTLNVRGLVTVGTFVRATIDCLEDAGVVASVLLLQETKLRSSAAAPRIARATTSPRGAIVRR